MVNSNLAYQNGVLVSDETMLKKDPVKWCAVSLSDVMISGKRLDAQKYDMSLRMAQSTILNSKYGVKYIIGNENGVCSAYRPGICKRVFVKRAGDALPMYTPSQILDIYPKTDKFLSGRFCSRIPDWFVQEGEILLTCSGTIGNIALVTKTLQGKCVSQNLIRIVPKSPRDVGYIYTYLKSEHGQLFLTHSNYGAVIKHIDPEHLATVPIPDAPNEIKERIHNLIVQSYSLRDESNDLIDQATQLLIDELHLPDIRDFEVKDYKKNAPIETYSVKLSELNGRVDASYHVPIVDAIVEHLKKYAEEVTTVGDKRISSEVILPGRFKRVYVDEGYGRVFIGGKQLWELDPSNKKYLSLVHHGDRIDKQLSLHENMTLITCSGTIGKVAMVGKHWENWTANQHIIRVVPACKRIAGYLNVFLASEYGHQLITRFTYGSVVDEIDDNHVRQIAIPLLKNKDMQKKINDYALEANEKRYEAFKLEQQALRIMDDEVIYAK